MSARALALLIALCVPGFSARASAVEAAGDRGARSVQVVTIEVSGDPAAVARTRVVAGELLTRLGVASIVTSVAADTKAPEQLALVRAYFDLRDPAQPGIVVVEGQSGREVVRRDLPESSSLEVSVEELSHVLYAVVEAVLRDTPPAPEPRAEPRQAAPTPPAAAPSKPVRPSPKAAQRSGADFEAGAYFRVLELGSSQIVPGGGVSLLARTSQGRVTPGALLMAAAHSSATLTYDSATAGVRPFSLRLYPTLNVAVSSSASLIAGLGAGIDWFRVERERTPSTALSGVSSVLDMTLSGLFGARFQVSADLTIDAAASLDLDLTPRSFVVETETGRSTLLELGRLRPGATLGASYSLASGVGTSAQRGNP